MNIKYHDHNPPASIFIKENTFYDCNPEWTMTIKITGASFERLKDYAQEVLEGVVKATDPRRFPIKRETPLVGSYEVTWESPIADRIARLRKEADELEATLGGPREQDKPT